MFYFVYLGSSLFVCTSITNEALSVQEGKNCTKDKFLNKLFFIYRQSLVKIMICNKTGHGGQVVLGAFSNSSRQNALGPRFESPSGIISGPNTGSNSGGGQIKKMIVISPFTLFHGKTSSHHIFHPSGV